MVYPPIICGRREHSCTVLDTRSARMFRMVPLGTAGEATWPAEQADLTFRTCAQTH